MASAGSASGRRAVLRFLRSLLSGLFFVSFGVGSLVLGLLVLPALAAFPGDGMARRAKMRSAVRAGHRLFVWCAAVTGLFRVELSREDRAALGKLRGHVVVMNHPTLIDIVILNACLPDMTCVVKASALRNPFFSRIVRVLYLVNGDSPEHLLREARASLASGVNVVVFPEGTRTSPETLSRPMRRGAAHIAIHACAPVCCLRMVCDPPVLGKNAPWYAVSDRTIVFCIERAGVIMPPERAEGHSAHAAAVRLTADIQSLIACEASTS